MEKIFASVRQSKVVGKLPKKSEIQVALDSFSKNEWKVFFSFLLVLLVSTIVILQNLNQSFMDSVPLRGGSIREGIVGTPRFVNPALAFSDADRDLVSLIYSGLMRKDASGTLVPDLAESVEVGGDGLSYTFILKDEIYFHNGSPVTVDDIIFTINSVKDPILKSPRKGTWDGVNVAKIDDKTVQFSLQQPYASFLENATIGIMPSALWSDSPIELSELNVKPVGSGPYKVKRVNKASSGSINSYELGYFKKFSLGAPFLKNIKLNFYSNEDELVSALLKKEVAQVSSISPLRAEELKEKGYESKSAILPRVFGLFFNQNQNQLFLDKEIVEAIDTAIDKEKLVREVLGGYGAVIDDPIPTNIITHPSVLKAGAVEDHLAQAANILERDGWKKNEAGVLEKVTDKSKKTKSIIEFSISTSNAPELAKAAELIRADLEALGMKVDVKTFEVGNLNQSVIRPRKYDVLLFGEIINHESDLFAFWHSSQRNDPGLNVALYTNAKVDKILEDAFITVDEKARVAKYTEFENEIKKDMPAVFLYSPSFVYVVSKDLQGLEMDNLISPADRFLSAHLWYTEEDKVWKIFSPD